MKFLLGPPPPLRRQTASSAANALADAAAQKCVAWRLAVVVPVGGNGVFSGFGV